MSVTITTKQVTQKTQRFTCDVCKKPSRENRICDACGIDLCRRCRVYDGEGDYPNVYCRECWELGKPYREKIEEYENQQELAVEAWKEACVAARKKIDSEKEAVPK